MSRTSRQSGGVTRGAEDCKHNGGVSAETGVLESAQPLDVVRACSGPSGKRSAIFMPLQEFQSVDARRSDQAEDASMRFDKTGDAAYTPTKK